MVKIWDVWDSTSGQALLTLQPNVGRFPSIALSPDGLRLIATGPEGVKLWDVRPAK